MTTWNTSKIRETFLRFFEEKGHAVMPSYPLVPQNDPTLMFTNAGMVQFKNIFTGMETPKSATAATSQKCVRAGGKHNDLDNVGYTARHHTFFEMLGNFSFAEYFKEKAIPYAWELLTSPDWFALPPEKLYVTVYHTDDEAFDLWKETTSFPDEKILRVPTKDNFWAMGDTGPCGPCSEIFYDHGIGQGEWALDDTGHDLFDERYVEIWNLVFMQYEQVSADERKNLPNPAIDTGMGLERMAAVMQVTHDNYAIDLFQNLIAAIKVHINTNGHEASYRVIADHLRSCCFLMADGVLPSNEGRGYVLRRIMRRAMRHAHILGCKEPLMHKLVPALVSEMGEAYPELKRAEAILTTNLKQEEERFRTTLDRGLKLLEEESANLNAGDSLPGETAFKLYDTYGFPLDLTEDILRTRDIAVDNEGFDTAMTEQKARARAAHGGSGDTATSTLWFNLKEQHGSTEFLGYTQQEGVGIILALVKDSEVVEQANEGDAIQIITNQTPFYGESGGQMGDAGIANMNGEVVAEIKDTQKPLDNFHVHFAIANTSFKTGDTIELHVDHHRRMRLRANHSATHLLNFALRKYLGDHVAQKGSLVSPDKLRFDISHPQAITKEEIALLENEVNQLIWDNAVQTTQLMSPDEAVEQGAVAMFGEKYGEEVRVLTIGPSVELCGGTHVTRTGDIGLFKITSESAIAAGVRRIEGVTGEDAMAYLNTQESTVRTLADQLKTPVGELEERIAALQQERKSLEKELAEAKKKLALGGGGGNDAAPEAIGEYQFIGQSFTDLPPKELRDLANELIARAGDNGIVAIGSNFEGKASLIVALGNDAAGPLDAPTLVRQAVEIVGGKGGGGKPNFAQAGGPDGAKIPDAIAAIKSAAA